MSLSVALNIAFGPLVLWTIWLLIRREVMYAKLRELHNKQALLEVLIDQMRERLDEEGGSLVPLRELMQELEDCHRESRELLLQIMDLR